MTFISMEQWRYGTRCNIFMLGCLLVVHACIGLASGACTFPSDIRGNWVSSDKGTLNFTSDTIVDYPVNPITVSVNSLSFSCTNQSGDKYLLSSTDTFELFSLPFRAYLCLEIHQISDYKFWYQIGNEIETTNNERFIALPSAVPVDFDNGCARSEPYETATFNTLVKEGAVDAGLAEATCPYSILHTFSTGSLESSTGSTACSNVTIDMCADRTRMLQTYDEGCDSSLKIANGGVSICLLDFTNDTSGVTYLHVWNNDTTLTTGIGRINCYAFAQSGDTFNGTIYPSSCTEEQTDIDVNAPGIRFYYDTITNTCQNVVESGPDTIYYIAIILGGLVFIFIIVLLICIAVKTKCRCCRKLRKKKKVGHTSRITVASCKENDGDSIDKDSENDDIEANTRAARKSAIDVRYHTDKESEDNEIKAYARPRKTVRKDATNVRISSDKESENNEANARTRRIERTAKEDSIDSIYTTDKEGEDNDIKANTRSRKTARKDATDVRYSIDRESEDKDIKSNERTQRNARTAKKDAIVVMDYIEKESADNDIKANARPRKTARKARKDAKHVIHSTDKESADNGIKANAKTPKTARTARKDAMEVIDYIDKESDGNDIEASARSRKPIGKDAMDVMFIARKPIKLSPITSPYLKPPAKVELLYDVIPKPMSNKPVSDNSLFMSQVSLRYNR